MKSKEIVLHGKVLGAWDSKQNRGAFEWSTKKARKSSNRGPLG